MTIAQKSVPCLAGSFAIVNQLSTEQIFIMSMNDKALNKLELILKEDPRFRGCDFSRAEIAEIASNLIPLVRAVYFNVPEVKRPTNDFSASQSGDSE